MCDTLGICQKGLVLFGKNSDRSPNEPQALEYHKPRQPSVDGKLHVTYETIQDHTKPTFSALLSRPVWMWGAEMGVNECGVCIGNEAVFTKGRYGKTGLTGMDLVRIALERCESADCAVNTIVALIEQYGQGGNCGFDHAFYYDNSFLILDRKKLFVLETSGREWAVRSSERDAISNRLSIGEEGTIYSGGERCDFTKRHLEPVYSFFSGSASRRGQSLHALESMQSVTEMLSALRTHKAGVDAPLCRSTVDSCCMHAGGAIGDHTTASLAVLVTESAIRVFATGGSTPCISAFKPWLFGNAPVAPIFAAGDPAASAYWLTHERFCRSFIGKRLPERYYAERNRMEDKWVQDAISANADQMATISSEADREERAFCASWNGVRFSDGKPSRAFLRYWNKKNRLLGGE